MSNFNEEELRQMDSIMKKFESDLKGFCSDVETENPIQVILKGHLYIEHELIELLKRKLVDHTKLNLNKCTFSMLYKLVFAMGLLPDEIYYVIKAINNLRNDCAHNLSYTFGPKEWKYIEDTLSGNFKRQYESFLSSSCKDQSKELIKLQMVLFTIWEAIKSDNIIPDNIKSKLAEGLK